MTDFEKFYEAFIRKLERVAIPPEHFTGGENVGYVSWDRKAAYLLFVQMQARKGV